MGHYANARSFTQWGADTDGKENWKDSPHRAVCVDPVTGATNGSHILARGDTHLAFAMPKFGTPCAALLGAEERKRASEFAMRMIAEMNNGLMGCAIADPTVEHDDANKEPVGY